MELMGFITLESLVLLGITDFCNFASSSSFLDILTERRAVGRNCGLPGGFVHWELYLGSTLLHMVAHGCGIGNKGPTSEGMVRVYT